jgi:hypothetical protein
MENEHTYMMRLLFVLGMFAGLFQPIQAQETNPVDTDTTIYDFADRMPFPVLPACVRDKPADWPIDSVRRCGETQLMRLLAQNIRYPALARDSNIQGSVVVSFIVEKNGRISRPVILRDIGGGCGKEALRVLGALDEVGLRWQPGIKDKMAVRTRTAVPLRFKLEEALPYYITNNRDTIYSTVESEAGFKYGMDSLVSYIINQLDYPVEYQDSCKTGVIEMSLLIQKNGAVKVENQLDFSNLGLEFQWEAMRFANKTFNLWTPATYQGAPVNATLPLRVVFKSDAPACKLANERFDKMMLKADEGAQLLEKDQVDAAIASWTEALTLDPNNTEILYYRGTAYLNQNKRDEACKDYNRIKQLLGITWFEGVRKVVCGW